MEGWKKVDASGVSLKRKEDPQAEPHLRSGNKAAMFMGRKRKLNALYMLPLHCAGMCSHYLSRSGYLYLNHHIRTPTTFCSSISSYSYQ